MAWGFFKRKTNTFSQAIQAGLPPTMHLPEEFIKLFNWIESVGGIGMGQIGKFAVVDPMLVSKASGSCVYFHEPYDDHWLSPTPLSENSRLRPFCQTGGDGSAAAFWLDDDGNQRIVHLGSGSGSTMVGTWVNTPLEFLTLLAIGYEELCWLDDYNKKPIDCDVDKDNFREPTLYQQWLVDSYGVEIPQTASKIVAKMSKPGEKSKDLFCQWLQSFE